MSGLELELLAMVRELTAELVDERGDATLVARARALIARAEARKSSACWRCGSVTIAHTEECWKLQEKEAQTS